MATDPFIDTGDLSDYLGRDVTLDPGATIAIDSACDMVRNATEQTFNRGTSTITLDGTDTDALMLPEVPVNAVSEVSFFTADAGWTTAGTADYALNGDGILFARDSAGTSVFGATWPRGRQNIQVTYDHGYDDADLPRNVRMIALMIASRLFLQGPKASENFGDVSVTWSVAATDLTDGEHLHLAKHRRKRSF